MSDSETALVLGMPWPTGGTHHVMASEVEVLHTLGLRAVFVATPAGFGVHSGARVRATFAREQTLGADELVQPGFVRRPIVRWLGAHVASAWRGGSVAFAGEPGRAVPLPPRLVDLARDRRTRVVVVNHVFALPLAERIVRAAGRRLPLVLVTHDVQSHLAAVARTPHPLTRRAQREAALLPYEVAMLARADVLVHVSADDLARFSALLPRAEHHLALPTLPSFAVPRAESATLGFIGDDHAANRQALLWYAREVLPRLGPDAPLLRVAGRVGGGTIAREAAVAAHPRIQLVQRVRDLAAFYAGTRVVIAPMVSGGGISLKTIEACAGGLPFVGTRAAFRGMPLARVRAAGIAWHDDADAFAAAVRATLAAPEASAAAGRRLYAELFRAEQFAASFGASLAAVGVRARARAA